MRSFYVPLCLRLEFYPVITVFPIRQWPTDLGLFLEGIEALQVNVHFVNLADLGYNPSSAPH